MNISFSTLKTKNNYLAGGDASALDC